MTTKEQERKALEEIRQIVADLGEQSYLGSAFTGTFDLAEQNIDFDAAFTMTGQIDVIAEAKAKQATEKMQQELDAVIRERDTLRDTCNRWKETHKSALEANANISQDYLDLRDSHEEIKLEVIRLKAKLYDMMMSQEVAAS
ncbi:hypothetical protein [Acetonema longum]|uniref:Uncharacterized protein n=1 Tax=Acetonema longum DSM 6540 TaxID=1009370 RepID=F7NEJ2_9FIRM|nr:hypothetical protein [Acetonema longum]EGO65403.1 hypothetical protein ALO_02276 [Acetonema longum DSM 6540]